MRYLLVLIHSLFFLHLSGQELKLDTAYYDSLHQFLLESNLTHYSIFHNDTLAYNWQSPDCDDDLVNTASLMKSITALAIGELLENNFIDSIEDPVCKYIPEWKAGCENDVTIKHLITMTSGVLRKPHAERVKFFTTNDWNSFVLNLELDTLPGSVWAYSNEAGQLLEPIIRNSSGMDVQEFFDQYVLHPLGMNNTKLLQDSAGNYSTIGGAETRISDLVNMGRAILNNGKFNDQQIIDPAFLEEVLTPITQNPYYGYLWWIDPENNAYIAMGDGGVYMFVLPKKQLVFVRANNCNTGYDPMKWRGSDYIKTISRIIK